MGVGGEFGFKKDEPLRGKQRLKNRIESLRRVAPVADNRTIPPAGYAHEPSSNNGATISRSKSR